MSNVQFIHPIKGSPDRAVEIMFGTLTFGASGAIASSSLNGFTAAKETAAGTYTLTFAKPVTRVLNVQAMPVLQTVADSQYGVNAGTVTTTAVQLELATGGTLTNPVSGDSVYIMIVVARTDIPRKGLGTS